MKNIFKKFLSLIIILNTLNLYPAKADNGIYNITDNYLMAEAENLLNINPYYKKEQSDFASGGFYLRPLGENKDDKRNPDIIINFNCEKEDYYTFYVRANYLKNETSGNYFIDIDGNREMVHFDNCKDFTWNSCKTVKLKKGKHSFGIIPRRSHVGIDKIFITSSLYYVPEGMGEAPYPFVLGEKGSHMKDKYYPHSSYIPPKEHPILYLREKDIPKIKENLTHPQNIKAWEEVKRNADKNIDCVRYANRYYGFNPEINTYVESMAFLYALDKNKNLSYGVKAVKCLKDYLSNIDYSINKLEAKRSGIIQYIAKVYDWCYDLLTNEDKEFLIKKAIQNATKLECGWPPTKLSAFSSNHGGEGSLQNDMLSIALVTYYDYPDIWYTAGARYFKEYIPINNFYYNEASWNGEGDSYGKSRFGYEAKANALLDKLGLGNLISPNEHYIGYNQILRKRPDGNFMMDGDIWDTTFSMNLGTAYAGDPGSLLSLSSRYKDPYLKYELYKMRKHGLEKGNVDAKMTLCDFLILNDTSVPLKSHKDLPLTMYTGKGHNMMTARTSYDEGLESKAMIVSMKGGGRTRGSHMHLDSGNFTIYYKGPLALDSGVYNGLPYFDENGKYITNTHAGSYHDDNYNHRTIAHNCILVYDPDENMKFGTNGELNDGGQIPARYSNNINSTYEGATGDDKINAKNSGVDYGPSMNKPSYSYLKTDITNSYSDKVKDYERTFMFHNFFDDTYPGALIVLDKVESKNPSFKKTWLLHSQEEPLINDNITTIKRTEFGYNGRLINETLLPKKDNLSIAKVGGKGKEYMVGDKNVKAVTKAKGDESGKWRIEVTPKTLNNKDYFLNVLQVSDNDKNIKPLKSTLYESGNYVGIKIKDRVTYLSKEKQRTSEDVLIYADGNYGEILEYTVDGLNMGKWNILDMSNNVLASSFVYENGGVAYFKLKPGSYILRKITDEKKVKDFNILNATEKENPLEIKLCYNTLYEYFDKNYPIKEKEGIIYLPFKRTLDIMDSYGKYEEKENEIKILYKDKNYIFGIGKNIVLCDNISKNIKNPIIRENGISYMPHTVFSEIFDKNVYYDNIGKILWVNNNKFTSRDYIVNTNEENKIHIKNTSENAYKSHDGNPITYLYTNKNSEEFIYEFKDNAYLNNIEILWQEGHNKNYNYEFYLSEDNKNYKLIKKGSSEKSYDFVKYNIESTKAKYFKIKALGNNINNDFKISEIKFYKEEEKPISCNITYTDISGKPLTKLEGKVVLNCEIINNNTFDINKNYVFITGLYKNDILEKIFIKEGLLHSKDNLSFEIDMKKGEYVLKNFLWDNLNRLSPLSPSFTFNQSLKNWLKDSKYSEYNDAGIAVYDYE